MGEAARFFFIKKAEIREGKAVVFTLTKARKNFFCFCK